MRDSVTYNASFPVANVVLKFYTSLGPVPKGYTKRQKFLERQKHLENSNQSHVEARNRVHLEKWPKGAISKYRGEMIAGRAARREELFRSRGIN